MASAVDEAREAGRRARSDTPRRALAEVAERPSDYDPVDRILWQGEGRVAALLPFRYRRMGVSEFAFLRGAALIMTDDLARGPATPLEVQIGGDAHAANFGVFSSPERRPIFDLNDFDETDCGPFEWDVKRLVTSLVVVAAQRGDDNAVLTALAEDTASSYQRSLAVFAAAPRLDVWYAALDVETGLSELRGFFTDTAARAVDDVIRRAKSKEPRTFSHLVDVVDGHPTIRPDPPHVTSLNDASNGALLTRDDLERVLAGYVTTLASERQVLATQFTFVDGARLVRGVGSVGTQCFAVLLTGRDDSDLLFLQIKEAQRSVISIARGTDESLDPGERVVTGQRLMQATPDALLGWHSISVGGSSCSFYVRQLYDQRASVALDRLSATQLRAYARACAWVLARAHARSGLSAEISGYVGEGRQFARSVGAFALAYRERNAKDFRAFTKAVAQGRIPAAT